VNGDGKPYELLDHTADAMVRVRGADLGSMLEAAALAMFDLQYGLSAVSEEEERVVEARAPDKEMLLVRLLTLLLSVSEAEGLVFHRFRVQVRRGSAAPDGSISPLTARCVARGARFDPERHERHIHVKAVTYHGISVDEARGEAVIVFDK
jgi:SHS2 domain-containing protein